MNIKQVLPLGFAILIILVSIIGLITINNATSLKTSSDWVYHTYQVQYLLRGIEKSLVDAETGQRGFIIAAQDNFLEPYNQTIKHLGDEFEQLSAEISDNPIQLERLAEVEALAEDKLKELQQTIQLKKAGNDQKVLEIFLAEKGKKIMDKIRMKIVEMIEVENQLLNQRQETAQRDYQSIIFLLILGLVTVFMIGIVILLIINKVAIQPINEIANIMTMLANEIAITIEQQERTASFQAASVNTTTTAMDELEASSRQSAEQTDAASDKAQLALRATEQGNFAVTETLKSMNQLKQKVEAIGDNIIKLSEQTNKIGNISQIVSNFASQTNMLALNAAVEAVRAGEQGKGFSVVASEIKKLAEQSQKSTEQINKLVDEIQNSIRSTVIVTDEGQKTVDVGMNMIDTATQAFAGIRDAIYTVVTYNQQIYLNVQQQAIAIKQVVEEMNSINQGAKETVLSIGQTRIVTQNLRRVAEQLKAVV